MTDQSGMIENQLAQQLALKLDPNKWGDQHHEYQDLNSLQAFARSFNQDDWRQTARYCEAHKADGLLPFSVTEKLRSFELSVGPKTIAKMDNDRDVVCMAGAISSLVFTGILGFKTVARSAVATGCVGLWYWLDMHGRTQNHELAHLQIPKDSLSTSDKLSNQLCK
jgi:hypothetical protein